MEKLLRSANGTLGNAVDLILKEFLMEIDSVCRMLEDPNPTSELPVRLEGKMYKSRYLSNVLGNEIVELKSNRE
jgi:hypothetical protein